MLIIAEIGQAHEGSLGLAHSYIDALADTGVDVVKFQTHIADAESSSYEAFRVNFSYEDKTRYDYWKRMEFTIEQWAGLKQHCEDKGMEFVSSPFSVTAAELLEKIGVSRYKIGSGEIQNYLMLDFIAKTGKEIWLSSGMSSESEIQETLEFLAPHKSQIALFQCTTEYPTSPETWGLNVISEWKQHFNLPIGFSDHSGDIFACLAAATLGAEFLEFHAVFDKNMFGPDTKASLEIKSIKKLVLGVKQITAALKNPILKSDNSRFDANKILFGKSLAVREHVENGTELNALMLETKKPGNQGIPSKDFAKVLGRSINKTLNKGSFLNWEDLNEG